jgi:hypothetical protein
MRKLNDGRSKNIGRVAVTLTLAMLAIGACSPAPQAVGANQLKGEFGSDSAATRAYVDKLDFQISGMADSVWVADYPCVGTCGTKTSTKLMFVPSSSAQHVNWENNLKSGAAGDVVAMVINVDDHDYIGGETLAGPANLTLAPNQHAYAWVGQIKKDDPAARGFGIYTIDSTGKKTGGPWWVKQESGISYCRFDSPADRKPAIHQRHPNEKCKTAAAQAFPFTSIAYAAETSAMMQPLGGDLWFSCDMGCCQITAFQ